MTPYADVARLRAEPAAVASQGRLSIARRPFLDLPLAVNAGQANTSAPHGGADTAEGAPDLELGANFDVPAFLRRQDG
jgi:hypothetical protein